MWWEIRLRILEGCNQVTRDHEVRPINFGLLIPFEEDFDLVKSDLDAGDAVLFDGIGYESQDGPLPCGALVRDQLPKFLGKGYGPNNEPRAGTVLTFAMAQVGIVLGNLDVIAPVLTMFFLATYGVTNLACGLQRWAASPSFRI